MKRNVIIVVLALGCIALGAERLLGHRATTAEPVRPAAAAPPLVAAAGVVEAVSEELEIGADIPGRLAEVRAEEGRRVRRGEVLAVLENADYRARVALARARLAEAEAALRRVVNGARGQERHEALAAVAEARAVTRSARSESERRARLFAEGVISREEAERAEREHRVAVAREEAAVQRHALVDDEAREEDRAAAEAAVARCRAEVAEADARLEKTIVRAPIDGVVVRKHMHAGETVTDRTATPILTLADSAILRVRVDVDERDVARVSPGQRAYVTAAAYGDARFHGRVIRVGESLGRKNVRTDEPAERVDTKVLETLVELDPGQRLPLGLRVDAFLLVGGGE